MLEIRDDILKGCRVVVIDDEPDSLYLVQFLLESYGAEVMRAIDGADGLERIREHKPVFVVADIAMPNMTGYEMMRELKRDPDIADIPVIALSAHAMMEDRGQALDAGFHNYLIKPLRPKTFVPDLVAMLADVPQLAKVINP